MYLTVTLAGLRDMCECATHSHAHGQENDGHTACELMTVSDHDASPDYNWVNQFVFQVAHFEKLCSLLAGIP